MRTLLLGALMLFLCTSWAHADDAADKVKARALFKQAETSYRLGKFKDALAGYEAALKAAHSPTIIFNIAQCHRQLGDPRKAIFSYKLFLSDWKRMKPGTNPPNKKEVDRYIAALKVQVVEQEKAEEEARRKKEMEEAKKKAEEEAKAKAEEEARKLAEVNAKLAEKEQGGEGEEGKGEGKGKGKDEEKAKPERIAVGYATLSGVEVEGAQVEVHGQVMGTTSLSRPLRLSVGRNRIEVIHESYRHWSTTVEIKEGETVDVQVVLRPKNSPHRILLGTSIVCFLLTGGSQGLAQVMGSADESDLEDYDTKKATYDKEYLDWQNGLLSTEPEAPREVPSDKNDVAIAGHVMTGVFGAAALGTLIGFIVTYVKYTRPDPAPAAPADPAVTLLPSLNGVTLMGRF